ncbi:MAG: hypothetical protein AAGB22_11205 [Bacteroidota bacterium]
MFSSQLSRPFHFNALKHHLHFLAWTIYMQPADRLSGLLARIGTNQMDLYTGQLSLDHLEQELTTVLPANALATPAHLASWLQEEKRAYRTVTLFDDSVWVVRHGVHPGSHVHVHPGRHTPHTTRVKASTLKTAVLATALAVKQQQHKVNDAMVAEARQVLDLGPLPPGTADGLDRVLQLVGDKVFPLPNAL